MTNQRINFQSAGATRKPQPTMTFNEIAEQYAPYHTMKEFTEGYTAYLEHNYEERYHREDQGLQAQAWDRGMEAAMRYTRQFGGV